jgi:hypothetical protein
MSFNNNSENDVLSRSNINADTNSCSNGFSELSSLKDVVDNNLCERFQNNNTIAKKMNINNIKPLEVLLSSQTSDSPDKQIPSKFINSNSFNNSLVNNNITLHSSTHSSSIVDLSLLTIFLILKTIYYMSVVISLYYYMSILILIIVIFMLTILLMLM